MKAWILLMLSIFPYVSHAANIQVSGEIVVLRSHTSDALAGDSWVQLEGVSGVTGCVEGDSGAGVLTYILVPESESQLYTLLLSSFTAGGLVSVNIDNALLTHGICTIRHATLIR